MNRRTTICAAAALIMLGFSAAGSAKEVPYQTQGQLKSKCQQAGGLYGPPSAGGVYTCILESGNVIACGGQGDDAKTCETGDTPARVRRPVRVLPDLSIVKQKDASTP